MAANDTTISVAAASSSVKVRKLVRRTRDTLPIPSGSPTVIAAGGSQVFNLAPGDSLVVERADTIASVSDIVHHGGSKEDFDK